MIKNRISASIYTFLKTALIAGLVFSSGMTIINLMKGGTFDLSSFLFYFVSYGICMGLFNVAYLSYIHEESSEDLHYKDDFYKTHQNRRLTSSLGPTKLTELLKFSSHFEEDDIIHIQEKILISTGFSFQSFGEKIEISSSQKPDNKFEYVITSKPKVPLTLMDGGKNFVNVSRIHQWLRD